MSSTPSTAKHKSVNDSIKTPSNSKLSSVSPKNANKAPELPLSVMSSDPPANFGPANKPSESEIKSSGNSTTAQTLSGRSHSETDNNATATSQIRNGVPMPAEPAKQTKLLPKLREANGSKGSTISLGQTQPPMSRQTTVSPEGTRQPKTNSSAGDAALHPRPEDLAAAAEAAVDQAIRSMGLAALMQARASPTPGAIPSVKPQSQRDVTVPPNPRGHQSNTIDRSHGLGSIGKYPVTRNDGQANKPAPVPEGAAIRQHASTVQPKAFPATNAHLATLKRPREISPPTKPGSSTGPNKKQARKVVRKAAGSMSAKNANKIPLGAKRDGLKHASAIQLDPTRSSSNLPPRAVSGTNRSVAGQDDDETEASNEGSKPRWPRKGSRFGKKKGGQGGRGSSNHSSPAPSLIEEQQVTSGGRKFPSVNNGSNKAGGARSLSKGSQPGNGFAVASNKTAVTHGAGVERGSSMGGLLGNANSIKSQSKQQAGTPTKSNPFLNHLPETKREDIGPKSARKARLANKARDMTIKPYKPVIDYDKEIKETIAAIQSVRFKYENHRKVMLASDVQLSKEEWIKLQEECSQVPQLDHTRTKDPAIIVASSPDPAADADRFLNGVAADLATDASQHNSAPAPVPVPAPARTRISAKSYLAKISEWEKAKNSLNRWERRIELRAAVDSLSVHLVELRAEKARDAEYCQYMHRKRLTQLDMGRKRENVSGDEGQEVAACRWDADDPMCPLAGVGESE